MYNIYETLDLLNMDKPDLSDTDSWEIINLYPCERWIQTTEMFLRSISNRHQVPGRVIEVFWGICHYWHENQEITPRQRYYLLKNLSEQWHNLPLSARIKIYR